MTASGSPASCRHSKISTDRSKPFADLLAGFIRAHARLPYSWPSSAKLHAATSAASASDRYKLMMFAGVAWVGCRSVATKRELCVVGIGPCLVRIVGPAPISLKKSVLERGDIAAHVDARTLLSQAAVAGGPFGRSLANSLRFRAAAR